MQRIFDVPDAMPAGRNENEEVHHVADALRVPGILDLIGIIEARKRILVVVTSLAGLVAKSATLFQSGTSGRSHTFDAG